MSGAGVWLGFGRAVIVLCQLGWCWAGMDFCAAVFACRRLHPTPGAVAGLEEGRIYGEPCRVMPRGCRSSKPALSTALILFPYFTLALHLCLRLDSTDAVVCSAEGALCAHTGPRWTEDEAQVTAAGVTAAGSASPFCTLQDRNAWAFGYKWEIYGLRGDVAHNWM